MKRLIVKAWLSALLLVFSFIALAGNEQSDWERAQGMNSVKAYDSFLQDYPDGPHASEAREKAGQLSAGKIEKAGQSCDNLLPRLVYYAVAATNRVFIPAASLAKALAFAAECRYSRIIRERDRPRAVDGLLASRYVMETRLRDELASRAFLDIDVILLDLEQAVIMDAYDEIIKCSDQSAWVDTPRKKQLECSRPHREVQRRLAQAMADHAQYDFAHIHEVPDPKYRTDFWERYRKLSKSEFMVEIAHAYQLYSHAKNAQTRESDPEVTDKIETVAIRLAGGGKPLGSVGLGR